jgi:hypothetical protein
VVELEGTTDALSRARRPLPNRPAGPRTLRAVPPAHGPYLTNVADARLMMGITVEIPSRLLVTGRLARLPAKRDVTGFGCRDA